jgi:hypothetical protein
MQCLPRSVTDIRADARWAFIVGAPRCGTTSLSSYLADHPGVCFSNVKEPHYFSASDLRGLSDRALRHRIASDYLDRYFPKRGSATVMAEASVTYLYVPDQLDPILRLWPQAKFIIGVRNPLTMLPSLHQRLCFNGDETERDFARALALVPERRRGRSIPRSCAEPRWLDYWEAGRHGKYVSRFLEKLGRNRCFVYLFEDFASDPARIYSEILKFLGLPHDGREEYPTHRNSRDYRIGWLQRMLKRPPRSLVNLGGEGYARRFVSGPQRERGTAATALLAARKRILAWNRAPAPEVRLDPQLRSAIIAKFSSDVAHLERLVGRDLSHWFQGEGTLASLRSAAEPGSSDHFRHRQAEAITGAA